MILLIILLLLLCTLPTIGEGSSPLYFSVPQGVYTADFELEILGSDGEVFYTLDGSEPDRTSMLYTDPIPVSADRGPDV